MFSFSHPYWQTKIEFLKGVGPKRAEVLSGEMGIKEFSDLLLHFPFRYIDKTEHFSIAEASRHEESVQVLGVLLNIRTVSAGRGKSRLVAELRDKSGSLELVWFKGVKWIKDVLREGQTYFAYGKISMFNGKASMAHPELEPFSGLEGKKVALEPVYPSTELSHKYALHSKGLVKLTSQMLKNAPIDSLPETIPTYIRDAFRLMPRQMALQQIHFPDSEKNAIAARNRLKFEELFFLQLTVMYRREKNKANSIGFNFSQVGDKFMDFYENHLPFELTNAQKKVIKEIRVDVGSGNHMNRLLQGDVGSGKTIVAVLVMLLAIDNGFQACVMAPTEILAQQHYISIRGYLKEVGVKVAFLSGSVTGKERKQILEDLKAGSLDILIGTHALIEDTVVFKNLGLAIIDEQHRFGVEQRAQLWKKNKVAPHILVMTATPIPRTLAMTIYGDLNKSIINELPPGRKPIKTVHLTDAQRMKLYRFIKKEIDEGRQIYFVYPLIEESEKLELADVMSSYERLREYFKEEKYKFSIVHGRMHPDDKELEMQNFVAGRTNIMIATTVIEVGVNVPNASVMVIENVERFGLAQLHQLRGRVGRGSDEAFCFLMSSGKLSNEAKERIQAMVSTQDGFKIAQKDLEMRGPGNVAGTQQSGIINFRIAELSEDGRIVELVHKVVRKVLKDDPNLIDEKNRRLLTFIQNNGRKFQLWSNIS